MSRDAAPARSRRLARSSAFPRARCSPSASSTTSRSRGGRRRRSWGAVALSAHGLKASARLTATASPEPFSNWGLSFSEELAVVGVLWLAMSHPLVALAVGLALVACALLAAGWIVRALRRFFRGRPAPA